MGEGIRAMSCKYCEEYTDINATVTDTNMARYYAYIGYCISINGEHSARLVFTDDNDEWETEISYCPKCGADLRR